MFVALLRWILRRPKPKKGSSISLCPKCGKHIFYHNGHSKAQHFREHHPEYNFKVERVHRDLQKDISRYTCLVCNKRFGNFQTLIERHRHLDTPQ